MKCRVLGLCAVLLIGDVAVGRTEEPPIWRQAGMKLLRGAINFSTGWMELPKQIYRIGQAEGWVTGAVQGPIDGLGMFVARTVAGAYEVLTFPVPVPPRYQPLFEPRFVWQDDPPPSAQPARSTESDVTAASS
ncbi:MAG TPA: exosortase system-associated protein, TIGR04073 family [Nitrospiraceae bacterium]|jgi:putative exosortase-associated protein (TIGR04073 family)|nr:exosortase system-associated protein, TIGR04073 family [Nitrospiraceae bacterium]